MTNLTATFNVCHAELSGYEHWDVRKCDWLCCFNGVIGTKSIDISAWDLSGCTNMNGLFTYSKELEEVKIGSINASGVRAMAEMFMECSDLKSIEMDFSGFSRVRSADSMFKGCSSLKEIDISDWNTSELTDCIEMFQNCTSLETIYLEMEAENIEWDQMMFDGCTSLCTIYQSTDFPVGRYVTNVLWVRFSSGWLWN